MHDTLPFAGEPNADFRARIARRHAEAAETRQRELLEQASTVNSPDLRIRIWERLHEVTLPRDAGHRLLDVIAAQTGLTMAQVKAEQHNRANPPLTPAPVAAPDPPAGPGKS
ncbi:MAG: hypothetical protein KGL25_03900 [Gammaproteobacteria bacterium]|nr:hypothetical protein [Gammaproteobacteria bacterium]MDE2250531.1 hypothetical protein [Gammaproteobacteria bacterium]